MHRVYPASYVLASRTMAQGDIRNLERERDLYLRLLELRQHAELGPFLDDALRLLVETSGAERGYIELHSPEDSGELPRWWRASGFSEDQLSAVRAQISSKIIAQALASGEIIETASAILDARFAELESVRLNQICAVLCAPIGDPVPVGVLYLQGRTGDLSFSPADRERAAAFARHLGPVAIDALRRHQTRQRRDPTAPFRKRIDASALVGRSDALARVLATLSSVAPLDITVLIQGPTGAGKGLVAEVLHRNSPRRHHPLVTVSCVAAPAERLEQELFGDEQRPGALAQADDGTLLLNAIDELPLTTQGKLLNFLDTGVYQPVDGSPAKTADVRLLTTTAVDLDALSGAGHFRADLRYRVQVLPIVVPNLNERRDDIALLAQHFCELACERHRLAPLEWTPSALAALAVHTWPGNVRQLANVVEAATTLAASAGAHAIDRGHLFPASAAQDERELSWQAAIGRFQRTYLETILDECDWNVARAARRLDLARSHIYNLIRGFGLNRD